MEINIKFDEKMIDEVANRVLDEYEYNGKTIREWADLIANPKTKIDRIRSMTDEELTEFIIGVCHEYYGFRRKIERGRIEFIEWLKSPTEGEG